MEKKIHVVKAGTGYEVVVTTGPDSIVTPVCCADAAALRHVLRSMGSTDIGVNNALQELKSYGNVELRL